MRHDPIELIAGPVAAVESAVYGGERLVSFFVTHHKPITPRPPPTYVSGAIGKTFFGREAELEQVMEYGPSYAAGTILGDVLVSYAVGKGVTWVGGKTWVLTKKVVPEAIKHPIYQAVKFGRVAKLAHKVKLAAPSYRGSRVDVFLAKHSKWYYKTTRGIAVGEVALPPIVEPVSIGKLKASKLAWELTQAPKTGGVWLARLGAAPAKMKVLPHLISIGGKISIGYLHEIPLVPLEEPYWQRGLLPFVTQKQVTRLGIIPYVPKAVSVTGKKGVSLFGATLVSAMPHAVPKLVARPVPKIKHKERLILTPKVWQPTLAYQREKLKPLTILEPKVKERKKLILIPKLPQLVTEEPITKLIVAPKLVQKTKQVLTPKLIAPPYIPTPQAPPSFFPYIPRGGRDVSRDVGGLFGRWFKRTHPIPSPEQVMRRVTRRKKRKRKKGGGPSWF